jgi:hypothetical protein
MATPLPAALLQSHDFTADVTCSSVTYAVIVMLISCLLCHNLVTAFYMLQYAHMWWNELLCFPTEISNPSAAFSDQLNILLSFSWNRMKWKWFIHFNMYLPLGIVSICDIPHFPWYTVSSDKALTFNVWSAPIGTLMSMVVIAEVPRFVHSGI